MKNSLLYIIIGLMVVSGIACIISAIFYKRWLKKKNEDQIIVTGKSDVRWTHALFCMFLDFPLTKNYVRRLRKQYQIIEPGEPVKIEKDTLRTLGVVGGVLLVLLSYFLVIGMSVDTCIVMLLGVYFISTYISFYRVNKKDMLLLRQIINFIVEVIHQYYSFGNVDEAVYEAILYAPVPIRHHAERIYEILVSDDIEEEMNIYMDSAPNRFLQMFTAICVTIIKFDDTEVDGRSNFVANLSKLRDDMEEEDRKRDKLNHKLGGLTLGCTIAVYLMKPIQNWAGLQMEELVHYYTGAYGVICFTIICVATVLIYNQIMNMHQVEFIFTSDHVYIDKMLDMPVVQRVVNNLKYKNYGKTLKLDKLLHQLGESISVEQLMVKRMLCAVSAVIIGLCISFIVHHNTRQYILTESNSLNNLVLTSASDKIVQEIKDVVFAVTDAYKDDPEIDLKSINDLLRKRGYFNNEQIILVTAKEIYNRITAYQNDYFMWYELLLIFGTAVIGYYIPLWMIYFRKRKLEMNMENEVVQFQSIILLLMNISRISSIDILKWMENFASIFRISISECIDEMANGEQQALESLKDKEPYPAFQKLVDNLLDCDRIGVKKAFDEVEADRKNFSEKRRHDNEKYIDNISATGVFLGFVPLELTAVLYIAGPFMMECFKEYAAYSTQIMTVI